jgi:ubiquinone biosynthesis protein UbiJ
VIHSEVLNLYHQTNDLIFRLNVSEHNPAKMFEYIAEIERDKKILEQKIDQLEQKLAMGKLK